MAQSSVFSLKTFEGPKFKVNLAALECVAGDKIIVHMPGEELTFTPESIQEFHQFIMKNFGPSTIIYTSSEGRHITLEVIRTVCLIEGE